MVGDGWLSMGWTELLAIWPHRPVEANQVAPSPLVTLLCDLRMPNSTPQNSGTFCNSQRSSPFPWIGARLRLRRSDFLVVMLLLEVSLTGRGGRRKVDQDQWISRSLNPAYPS